MLVLDTANAHTFVDALRFIADHPGFLATKALEQLELAGAALAIALVIALPAGVILGHLHRGSNVAIGSSIVGRALPSLVLIGVLLTVLGIGFVNNMTALAVLATGPDPDELLRGRGRRRPRRRRGRARDGHVRHAQILGRVELPLAVPLIFTGIRISAVIVVATAPIAAVAGGGGLGRRDREPGELPPRGRDRRLALRDGALGRGLAGAWCVAEEHSLPGHFGGLGWPKPAGR